MHVCSINPACGRLAYTLLYLLGKWWRWWSQLELWEAR